MEFKFEDFKNWVINNPSDSNYFMNLKNLFKLGEISANSFPIYCSAVHVFMKEMMNAPVKNLENRESNWVGNVGEKLSIKVKVLSMTDIESFYGSVKLHRFIDENGNILVWFCSGTPLKKKSAAMEEAGYNDPRVNVAPGDEFEIIGTVKAHDVYREKKQTSLTRVKKVK